MLRESGYVLLMMLVVLLGIGGAWLGVVGQSVYDRTAKGAVSTADLQALVDARQALLSYSVVYPKLYGPSGAGPAHLPCPDTDGYALKGVNAEMASLQRRDGSNPPCAYGSSLSGWLPRHTVLPGQRYLFHNQPWQRFDYAVASHMVNNPINRTVNASKLLAQASESAMRITLDTQERQGVDAQVVLTHRALLAASAAYVAAWTIERIDITRGNACSHVAAGAEAADTQNSNAALNNVVDECQIDSQSCPLDSLYRLLLDRPIVKKSTCMADDIALNTIEGVSATSHWFFRNQWQGSIALSRSTSCLSDELPKSNCVLSYKGVNSTDTPIGNPMLSLQWIERL